MIIREIKNLTHTESEELRNIYVSTFPLKKAKQLDAYTNHILDMLRNDKQYHLYAAIEGRTMIGISLLYVFEDLKMALLDYMAIIPNFQRRGIGRKLFEFTNNEFNRIIPCHSHTTLKSLYDTSTLTESVQCPHHQLQLKFLSGTSNHIMSKHVTVITAALAILMAFRRTDSVEL